MRKTISNGKTLVEVFSAPAIKATQFEVVSFYDELAKRQFIILYSLGADGIIREYANGKWTAFPITEENTQLASNL